MDRAVWIVLSVVLAGALVVMTVAYFVEKARYNELVKTYEELRDEHVSLILENSQLQERVRHLEWELNITENQMGILRSELNEALSETERYRELLRDTYDMLAKYVDTIEVLRAWIGENSKLDDGTFSEITEGCITGDELTYPCILYDRYGREVFRYVADRDERIESVSEFLQSKDGDCEDFSLFAAALVRKAAKRGLKIVFFYQGGHGELDLRGRWYIPDVTPVAMSVRDVNVVCGPQVGEDVAHCIIKVEDTRGSVYLVEPQSGEIYKESPLKEEREYITRDDYCRDGACLSEALAQIQEAMAKIEAEVRG
ncbi:MAG: hypothetical protein PWP76_302 [Candidatus Diapherotrites archaeon]|nr:hypothetical protein [Candidatus Diapherotrites archaeon]MDN5366822.1 hypothetical protein [Candidatus Diapherotrites archaeon]